MKIKILIIFFALNGLCSAELTEPKIYTEGVCSFKLYAFEMTPPIQNAILFGVDRILITYKDEFKLPYPDDFRINVTIINSQKDFFEYQKKNIGKVISQTGYFSGGPIRETVVWANVNVESMLAVLFHEASHMILMHQVPAVPMWANEGLSEYFEGLNVIGRKKQINLQQNRHGWMKHWAREGMPVPLNVYLDMDQKSWMKLDKMDSTVSYTLGYEVIYYLMSNSRNQEMLNKIINRFRLTGKKTKTSAMIEEYYKGGFDKFEEHFFKWIPKARKSRPLRALKKKKPVKKTETADKD